MLSQIIAVIGVWGGLGALALNLTAARLAPTADESRRRRFSVACASVVGFAICPLTLLVSVERGTRHGRVTDFGWPLVVTTPTMSDAYGGVSSIFYYVFETDILYQIAFWILVPQILIYVREQFFRARFPFASPTAPSPFKE
jgi:hypothetical protein